MAKSAPAPCLSSRAWMSCARVEPASAFPRGKAATATDSGLTRARTAWAGLVAQREEGAHALVEELADDRRDLVSRGPDAGQVSDRRERRLADDAADERAR